MPENSLNADGSISRVLSSEETSSKLLSQLLESTLSQKKRALSEQEWISLREVVTGSKNGPMPFEELVVAMVKAFLINRLGPTFRTGDALHSMCTTIARTLCSDPASRQRMVEFQEQLNGIS